MKQHLIPARRRSSSLTGPVYLDQSGRGVLDATEGLEVRRVTQVRRQRVVDCFRPRFEFDEEIVQVGPHDFVLFVHTNILLRYSLQHGDIS